MNDITHAMGCAPCCTCNVMMYNIVLTDETDETETHILRKAAPNQFCVFCGQPCVWFYIPKNLEFNIEELRQLQESEHAHKSSTN